MSLPETKARGKRKARLGRVVSTAMDKTVVVEVRNASAHSTYGKIVRRTKRLKAHDEGNSAAVGDTVRIAETRMGSGKGNPESWVAVVKPGRVMFELAGVPEPLAREAIRLAAHKLPIKCKFVAREQTLEVQ